MYIPRSVETKITDYLFKGKVLIIYGARQVGKTTMVKNILARNRAHPSSYINCDEGDYARALQEADTSTKLRQIIGDRPLVVLDEAQRIDGIGLKLKLLVDTYPNQQIIATGSSSFELGQTIIEPLTGRSIEFLLYPLSLAELRTVSTAREIDRTLDTLLVYGAYPDVYAAPSMEQKQITVNSITSNYLYKDILRFQNLKGAQTIQRLLEALALQIGNEVSYNELASLIGISKDTAASYIDILEKAFIVFRLPPLHRNRRKELGKLRKIYFYDTGIRNAIIRNQNALSLRNDIGALWENFIIAEMKKRHMYPSRQSRLFFWRTYDQQEVDVVEESGERIKGYEIKWERPRKSAPKSWRDLYPEASWSVIHRHNYQHVI